MKVSLNWLNKYIDVRHLKAQKIAEHLTDLGLEVEEIEELVPFTGKVVSGEIQSTTKHPNADKLNVCQVNVGNEVVTIVCGAPNVRAGIKVPIALPGSVLPGEFKIKTGKIRGEKSAGMICSAKELAIAEDNDGILHLPEQTTIGLPILDIFPLSDTILTLGLTPNRADCLGIFGIARDLAAKLDLPLIIPEIAENFGDMTLNTNNHLHVTVDDELDCGRFTGLLVKNIRPTASPTWLSALLKAVGQRTINLVVDATNYVMLETGHPIHAYDQKHIAGNRIHVRRARSQEKMTTLDGQTWELSTNDLLICDDEKPIALAGIMGGENSEVNDTTENLIIEVAHFNPSLIRKTSKKIGLHTEASHRFERGANIADTDYVAKRVAQIIIQEMAENSATSASTNEQPVVAGKLVDIYPTKFSRPKIALRMSRTRKILGLPLLTQEQCTGYLQSLGFSLMDKTEDRTLFEIPSHRQDIQREIDLIEEIARLHGFDAIPSTLPFMEVNANFENPFIEFNENLRTSIASLGLNEVINFPFVCDQDFVGLRIDENHILRRTVQLENPVSEPNYHMQPTLAANMLKVIERNRRFGDQGCQMFESAKCFLECPIPESITAKHPFWQLATHPGHHFSQHAMQENRPSERNRICGIIDQPFMKKTWSEGKIAANFFHGKSLIVSFLGSFNLKAIGFRPASQVEVPWLHPGKSAILSVAGQEIGYLGEVHPQTAQAFDLGLAQAPILFEIDVDTIYTLSRQPEHFHTGVSKFPPSTRDLAFVVDNSCSYKNFVEAILGFQKKRNLSTFRLFDAYQDEPLKEHQKSLAFTFSFSSDKRTLTDKEIEREVDLLKTHLMDSIAAELR